MLRFFRHSGDSETYKLKLLALIDKLIKYVTKLLPDIITLAANYAASTLGLGGFFQGRWFSSPWPPELSYIMDSEMPMAFRELYPIVVATVLWNKY
jgi:hypothetical protein